MCGRFTLRTPAQLVASHFNLSAQEEWQLALRYNIAPTQDVAVIRAVPEASPTAGRMLSMMRWGLVPSWMEDMKKGAPLINARSEEAATKPAFREAIRKRRCLIPADGFFEWRTEGKKKQPFYIRLREGGLFAFAGLWECWSRAGQPPIESCTILTTDANSLVDTLHDRMPVILSPVDYDAWLNPTTTDPSILSYLFEPFPASDLVAEPVNPVVNNWQTDSPECVQRV